MFVNFAQISTFRPKKSNVKSKEKNNSIEQNMVHIMGLFILTTKHYNQKPFKEILYNKVCYLKVKRMKYLIILKMI